MALSEIELKRCEKAIDGFLRARRPPVEIRNKLDLGCRIEGQSLYVFEIRPQWDDPDTIREHDIAKATYVRTQKCWKVFWMRQDLKWHGYDPAKTVKSVDQFLQIVAEDQLGCFFG
jgi:hypothetical protein